MPFDPTFPANGTPLESAPMRAQFNGLKDLIDAVSGVTSAQVDTVNTLPAGSPASVMVSVSGNVLHLSFDLPQGNDGPTGPAGQNGSDGAQGPPGSDGAQGAPFTNFVVDGVSTLNPGDNATVQANFDGSAVRLFFGIPRGETGTPGSNGSDGAQGPPGQPFTNFVVDNVNQLPPGSFPTVAANFDGSAVRLNFGIPQGNEGPQGSQGPQGPPFGNALVDGVTTLNPGDAAYVNTSFDGYNVHFTLGIPRGLNGSDGGTGPQGPPGEITQMQLDSAISGTSSNSNGVSTLDTAFADPDLESLRQAFNALVLALRR